MSGRESGLRSSSARPWRLYCLLRRAQESWQKSAKICKESKARVQIDVFTSVVFWVLLGQLCGLWAGEKASRRQEDQFGWETMKAHMKAVVEVQKEGGDFYRNHN